MVGFKAQSVYCYPPAKSLPMYSQGWLRQQEWPWLLFLCLSPVWADKPSQCLWHQYLWSRKSDISSCSWPLLGLCKCWKALRKIGKPVTGVTLKDNRANEHTAMPGETRTHEWCDSRREDRTALHNESHSSSDNDGDVASQPPEWEREIYTQIHKQKGINFCFHGLSAIRDHRKPQYNTIINDHVVLCTCAFSVTHKD